MTQSSHTLIWQEDFDYLEVTNPINVSVQASNSPLMDILTLKGYYNRLDAILAVKAVNLLKAGKISDLVLAINKFPGLKRRMEKIVDNLYSDYAHTPEKIRGAMSVATETAEGRKLVVIYEPLTNRRQHYILDNYNNCFDGASKVYWVPTYLAREDPDQNILSPEELIKHLTNPEIAEPAKLSSKLKKDIKRHLDQGDVVVAMSGGGGHSLDEWLRQQFKS